MAEYIDREAAIRELEREYVTLKGSLKMAESRSAREVFYLQMGQCRDVISALEATPLVDVAPVRHARWLPEIEEFDDDPAVGIRGGFAQTGWKCSACGRHEPEKEPYCNCGAKMDGGGDNAAD